MALARYAEALAINPDHPDALYYSGQLRYRRGEVGEAVAHFTHLAELEPRGLRAWQQLSLVRGQPRPGWVPDLRAAILAAQQALQLDRAESLNNLLLARWAAYSGDAQGARDWLQAALGHNPGLSGALALQEWLETRTADGWSRAPVPSVRLGPRHRLDLNGDGTLDLEVFGQRGRPAALGIPGTGGPVLLPAAERLRAWEHTDRRAGPWPVPVAGAVVGAGESERIIVVGGGSEGTRSFARRGELYVEVPPGLPQISGPPVLAVADFDADGFQDLVLGNVALANAEHEAALGARLYRGGSRGTFAAAGREIPGPIWAATAADLDGDGDPDLALVAPAELADAEEQPAKAAATGGAWEIQIWRNGAAGVRRAAALALPPGPPPLQLVVADINADGLADVLVLGAGEPELLGGGLWLGSVGGFSATDEMAPLGELRGAIAAWPLDRGLLVAAGGIVTGDPRRDRTVAVGSNERP